MAAASAALLGGTDCARGEFENLEAVPFTQVKIEDSFWAPRIKTNREKSIPHNFLMCEQTGRIANFTRAGGLEQGKFQGIFFNDSDVYKLLEGACYSLATNPDPVLEKQVDDLIAKIAAAQQEDGYINTYYTLAEPGKRWTDFPTRHELYCGGHLIEAGVAHYQATGKRTLLDVACRFADHVDSFLGPDKRHAVCGHEEIELALMKLYGVTGEERYRKLAEFFVNERGVERPDRKPYGEYCQDHVPVREQSEVCGHAVRAMYLFSACADVAAFTGDTALSDAMERVWKDLVYRKMYVTGGIGASAKNEGFTVPYDLPNDDAYAETCAAIGIVLWNSRLARLHADARYMDVAERAFYNGFLSGVSLDGEKFFYVNPLASVGKHHRESWFGCACCPPNVVRLLASFGSYVYAQKNDALYVNLYVAGSAKVALGETSVTLTQQTRYPWEGDVRIDVSPETSAAFDLCLRIPGWCEGASIKVNGQDLGELHTSKGYARVRREWKRGDWVELSMPMDVQRLESHPSVKPNAGRVALQRGPVVYCLEGVDNGGHVRNLALSREAELKAEFRPDLLGGVSVVRGKALSAQSEGWDDTLYRKVREPKTVEFTAVPYCVWDNREPGEMILWLPEAAGLAEVPTKAEDTKTTAP